MVCLGSAIFLYEPAGRFTHFVRKSVVDIDAIHDSDHRGFDRHVLIPDRRARSLAKSAQHHFSRACSESIGDDDDVARRFFVEVVRVHNQKPHALEVGRLLRGPDCAYDFC